MSVTQWGIIWVRNRFGKWESAACHRNCLAAVHTYFSLACAECTSKNWFDWFTGWNNWKYKGRPKKSWLVSRPGRWNCDTALKWQVWSLRSLLVICSVGDNLYGQMTQGSKVALLWHRGTSWLKELALEYHLMLRYTGIKERCQNSKKPLCVPGWQKSRERRSPKSLVLDENFKPYLVKTR